MNVSVRRVFSVPIPAPAPAQWRRYNEGPESCKEGQRKHERAYRSPRYPKPSASRLQKALKTFQNTKCFKCHSGGVSTPVRSPRRIPSVMRLRLRCMLSLHISYWHRSSATAGAFSPDDAHLAQPHLPHPLLLLLLKRAPVLCSAAPGPGGARARLVSLGGQR